MNESNSSTLYKPLDLTPIKEALWKASQGPWDMYCGRASDCHGMVWPIKSKKDVYVCDAFDTRNQELIANSPQWLADLCGEVERLRKALKDISEISGSPDKVVCLQMIYSAKMTAKAALDGEAG